MNKDDLFKSIGEIDDQTLISTESYRKRPRIHTFVKLIAASLAIVLMVLGISHLLPADNPAQALSSWFIITAQAEEGDWNELSLNDVCFNSVGTNQSISIFPTDVPLFEFVIKPSDWDKYQKEYWKFVTEISCNGNIVDHLDDHIVVFHQFYVSDPAGPHALIVKGWVEEPADIDITITDKETGMLIEKQTIHVCYIPDAKTYQLTVTNVQTNDTEK